MTTFVVPGRPVGKERPRVVNGRTFTPERTLEYEARVRFACLEHRVRPLKGDVALTVRFYTVGKRAPDADNLLKSLMDGLESRGSKWGGYENDVQVARIVAERFRDDENPRTEIEVGPA